MPFCGRLQDQPGVTKIPLASMHQECTTVCSYLSFIKLRFVQLLAKSINHPNGRTLYIMGDSIQEEQWISLVRLLGKDVVDEQATRRAINSTFNGKNSNYPGLISSIKETIQTLDNVQTYLYLIQLMPQHILMLILKFPNQILSTPPIIHFLSTSNVAKIYQLHVLTMPPLLMKRN